MNADQAKKWAEKFAIDLRGPIGQKPIAGIMSKHIQKFSELRRQDVSWVQIACLMKEYDIVGKNGKTIEASQWRAMFSQTLKKIQCKQLTTNFTPSVTNISNNLERQFENIASTNTPPAPDPAVTATTNFKKDVLARIHRASHLRRKNH